MRRVLAESFSSAIGCRIRGGRVSETRVSRARVFWRARENARSQAVELGERILGRVGRKLRSRRASRWVARQHRAHPRARRVSQETRPWPRVPGSPTRTREARTRTAAVRSGRRRLTPLSLLRLNASVVAPRVGARPRAGRRRRRRLRPRRRDSVHHRRKRAPGRAGDHPADGARDGRALANELLPGRQRRDGAQRGARAPPPPPPPPPRAQTQAQSANARTRLREEQRRGVGGVAGDAESTQYLVPFGRAEPETQTRLFQREARRQGRSVFGFRLGRFRFGRIENENAARCGFVGRRRARRDLGCSTILRDRSRRSPRSSPRSRSRLTRRSRRREEYRNARDFPAPTPRRRARRLSARRNSIATPPPRARPKSQRAGAPRRSVAARFSAPPDTQRGFRRFPP